MALEKTEIVDKLKAEGINENLGEGLTFETSDQLDTWVGNYKSALPQPVKKLEDYTKDELEELSKDPQFKGAKGLQGYIDSVRQKASKEKKPESKPEDKPADEEPEWAKNLRERFEKIEADKVSQDFDKTVERLAASENLNGKQIARIKKGLKPNATEAEIKAEIAEFKTELAELGIKIIGTPGGGGSLNKGDLKNSISRKYAEKHKKVNN